MFHLFVTVASIAAPVGVVSSDLIVVWLTGVPLTSSSVAGEGMGITPCALLTVSQPSEIGADIIQSALNASSKIAAAVISTIASIAPTS